MYGHRKSNWKKLRSHEFNWTTLKKRNKIIKAMRLFFDNNGFMEVDPPFLTPFPTLDSNIHSLSSNVLDSNGKQYTFYLHTSPEHSMKKLLAAGADKIYFLGKVFRDRECTAMHNPEFTMLEWYRANASYEDIMKDAEQLIASVSEQVLGQTSLMFGSKNFDLTRPFQRMTLRDLVFQNAKIDLYLNNTMDDLRNALKQNKVSFQEDEDWETLFSRLFLEKIEPDLGIPKPTFVIDYPISMGLMAKRKSHQPDWVERVELYIASVELANGYGELQDSQEQKERFQMEQKKRLEETGIKYPIDVELLDALEKGIPPSAGMALGVDRLVMLFMDKHNIEDVLFFPFHQMKNLDVFKNSNDSGQSE